VKMITTLVSRNDFSSVQQQQHAEVTDSLSSSVVQESGI